MKDDLEAIAALPDNLLAAGVEHHYGRSELVAELLKRFHARTCTATLKVDATAALEAIGDTAAQLANIATERNAVIDECRRTLRDSSYFAAALLLADLQDKADV